MFSKTKDDDQGSSQGQPRRTSRSAPSIISGDLTVHGSMSASGDIQIDGKVEGDITSGSITIGEKALVTGDVLAEDVIVRGKIVGSIRARKVQLCSTCHVEGDIYHQALAVETGAYFEGNCRHSDDPMKESVPGGAGGRRSSPVAAAPVAAPLGARRAANGLAPRPDLVAEAPPTPVAAKSPATPGPRLPGSLLGRPAPILGRGNSAPTVAGNKTK